jgi:hypothetical protein
VRIQIKEISFQPASLCLCVFVSLCEKSEGFVFVHGLSREMTHTKAERHEEGRCQLECTFAAWPPDPWLLAHGPGTHAAFVCGHAALGIGSQ